MWTFRSPRPRAGGSSPAAEWLSSPGRSSRLSPDSCASPPALAPRLSPGSSLCCRRGPGWPRPGADSGSGCGPLPTWRVVGKVYRNSSGKMFIIGFWSPTPGMEMVRLQSSRINTINTRKKIKSTFSLRSRYLVFNRQTARVHLG